MLSRDFEQADTADHVYRGLFRVRLIFSEKSASLGVQCQKCYGAKVTSERKGGRFWATAHTYLTFVTWLYTKSSRWTRISRSRCQATNTSGNDVIPEVTAHEFWNDVTWFWTSRHRWPRISRSHSRVIDIFREIGFPWCPVPKMLCSKSHPRKKGRSILSDHAHLSYLCHVTIYKVEPLNKNIAVSLPGNQYFRKWRKLGSDRARILKCCHVILNKQTPLTTYIAVSFACDWYFPRNRLPLVSSAKNAMEQKSPPTEREVDFERPRTLILPLSRDYTQSRAAEQEYRGLVARQPILPEMT